jgi:hypothetical protein
VIEVRVLTEEERDTFMRESVFRRRSAVVTGADLVRYERMKKLGEIETPENQ